MLHAGISAIYAEPSNLCTLESSFLNILSPWAVGYICHLPLSKCIDFELRHTNIFLAITHPLNSDQYFLINPHQRHSAPGCCNTSNSVSGGYSELKIAQENFRIWTLGGTTTLNRIRNSIRHFCKRNHIKFSSQFTEQVCNDDWHSACYTLFDFHILTCAFDQQNHVDNNY